MVKETYVISESINRYINPQNSFKKVTKELRSPPQIQAR